jgi:hypothetical protein
MIRCVGWVRRLWFSRIWLCNDLLAGTVGQLCLYRWLRDIPIYSTIIGLVIAIIYWHALCRATSRKYDGAYYQTWYCYLGHSYMMEINDMMERHCQAMVSPSASLDRWAHHRCIYILPSRKQAKWATLKLDVPLFFVDTLAFIIYFIIFGICSLYIISTTLWIL